MKKNIKYILLLLTIVLMSNGFLVSAATPESFFYLTWESNGLSPVDYQGKNLSSVDGVIKVSVQPLIYSGTGYSDSSQWQYRWYLNDEFANVDGVGIKQFRFRIKGYNLSNQEVRVKITFPNGTSQEKVVVIPIVSPRAVIKPVIKSITLRDGIINTNESEVALIATPYFFSNVNNLKIKWYRDGEYENNDSLVKNNIIVKPLGSNSFLMKILISDATDSLIRAIGQVRINFLGI
jgi:hypothetical protein